MLRSLYSGISGMKANQTKMDVVGNNVANVGTTAYKKTGTRFSDSLYQNMIYASKPGNGIGGVNPGQVGIGVKVSGIFKNMQQGAIQPTGRPTDLAIDGDGFFRVQVSKGNYAYTRDGSFALDTAGNLVTADGYYVIGKPIVDDTGATINDPIIRIPKAIDVKTGKIVDMDPAKPLPADAKRVLTFNFSKDGKLSYLLEDGTKMPYEDPTTKKIIGPQQALDIAVFRNPEGLESLGGNLYKTSSNSGEALKTDVLGKINQGAIEMANVDLSEEFTEMIVTTRAFQASSKIITTSDELLQEIINLKR